MPPKGKGKGAGGGAGDSKGGGGKGGGKADKGELGTCTFVKGEGSVSSDACHTVSAVWCHQEACSRVSFLSSLAFGVFAARHILCEKHGKIMEAYKKLQDGWLDAGDKVPPAKFGEVWTRGTVKSLVAFLLAAGGVTG